MRLRCIFPFALLFVLTTLWLAGRAAIAQGNHGNPNPGVIPINARYAGLTYGEWAARWWQWTDANFNVNSPELDTTGEKFGVGQSGPVWFLTWGFQGKIVRTVTVPAGTALFWPVTSFDTIFSYPHGAPLNVLRAEAETYFQMIFNPMAEVDGVPIKNLTSYRAVSPPYMITYPEEPLFGFPSGEFGPIVASGYWILLAPLPVGQHTIHFAWDIESWISAHFDVTYHITVTPGK